jgi:hypothetical protein
MMLIASLAFTSNLQIEAVPSSEKSVNFCYSTRLLIPENSIL